MFEALVADSPNDVYIPQLAQVPQQGQRVADKAAVQDQPSVGCQVVAQARELWLVLYKIGDRQLVATQDQPVSMAMCVNVQPSNLLVPGFRNNLVDERGNIVKTHLIKGHCRGQLSHIVINGDRGNDNAEDLITEYITIAWRPRVLECRNRRRRRI